ncbi:hypothetical protein HN734_00815 [Candidatus Woesearchaeota archaeon]|jgi:hypothetical protein|nr:hypothetical protein [Candidatus Woesearchaeota archaeon]MBT7762380.1 hypothetical protein [Candidatus Woesearchaeota archaeon]
MKKTRLVVALVLLVFLVGCAEEISEDELADKFDSLNDSELSYVLSEDDALVGEAKFGFKVSSKLRSLKSEVRKLNIECEDSDGGRNYEEAGNVTLRYSGREKVKSDGCWSDERRLQEYVCEDGNYRGDHTFDCSNLGEKYICEEGKCKEAEERGTVSLHCKPIVNPGTEIPCYLEIEGEPNGRSITFSIEAEGFPDQGDNFIYPSSNHLGSFDFSIAGWEEPITISVKEDIDWLTNLPEDIIAFFRIRAPNQLGEYQLRLSVDGQSTITNLNPREITSIQIIERDNSCSSDIELLTESPLSENQIRYFFEVFTTSNPDVLHESELVENDDFLNIRTPIARWNPADCHIPILFKQGWDTVAGQQVRRTIEERISSLTGGVYDVIFLNEHPELQELYDKYFISIEAPDWRRFGAQGDTLIAGDEIVGGHIYFARALLLEEASESITVHELGHALGYYHPWHFASFQSRIMYGRISSLFPLPEEIEVFRLLYKLPIGTTKRNVYELLDVEARGIDIMNGPPLIEEVRGESVQFGLLQPSQDSQDQFERGETMWIMGFRFTSARGCYTGFRGNIYNPTVYIGDRQFPLENFNDDQICVAIPILIPEDMEPGEKEVKVFVRGQWSNPVNIVIN